MVGQLCTDISEPPTQRSVGPAQRYVRMEAGFGRDKKLIFVVGECGESCSQYGDEN